MRFYNHDDDGGGVIQETIDRIHYNLLRALSAVSARTSPLRTSHPAAVDCVERPAAEARDVERRQHARHEAAVEDVGAPRAAGRGARQVLGDAHGRGQRSYRGWLGHARLGYTASVFGPPCDLLHQQE